MYTALQRIALTQAVGFEHFKNPVLPLPEPAALRVLLRHLARLLCLKANLGLSVLGYGHHRLLALVHGYVRLWFAGCDWGWSMVATGVVGRIDAAFGGNYERCAPFYHN